MTIRDEYLAISQDDSAIMKIVPVCDLTIPCLGTILESWGVAVGIFKTPVESMTWRNDIMGRFRNPRYAPEFLEKRLSPSGLGLSSTSVLVGSYSTTSSTANTYSDDTNPPPNPDPGPTPPPTGPSGPAY